MLKIALILISSAIPSLFFGQEKVQNELNSNISKDTTTVSSSPSESILESKNPENFGYTKTTSANGQVVYYKRNNNISIVYKPKQ